MTSDMLAESWSANVNATPLSLIYGVESALRQRVCLGKLLRAGLYAPSHHIHLLKALRKGRERLHSLTSPFYLEHGKEARRSIDTATTLADVDDTFSAVLQRTCHTVSTSDLRDIALCVRMVALHLRVAQLHTPSRTVVDNTGRVCVLGNARPCGDPRVQHCQPSLAAARESPRHFRTPGHLHRAR